MTKEESIVFENVLDTIVNNANVQRDIVLTRIAKGVVELEYDDAKTIVNTNGYSFLYSLSLLVNSDVAKALLK